MITPINPFKFREYIEKNYGVSVQKVEDLMDIQKKYLIKRYSREDMAKDLGISVNQLTFYLKTVFKQSYSNYVNQYRIDHMLGELKTNPKLKKLEGLASDAGFSNRNTMTTYFKRFVGKTPEEYFRNLKLVIKS